MKTRTVQLGEVCERVDYGFTASADFSIKEPRFLRITDIQNGAVDWLTVPGCIINPNDESANGLQSGDIVIARTGATTGKAFLIRHAPRAVFASYLIRLRCSGDVLPEYLDAFFQSEPYWSQVRNSMRGAAQAGVNATMLGELRVPCPPLPEQQRIAGVLEQADRLRRTRRYALELSDAFLPAAFRQLFGDPVRNSNGFDVAELGDFLSFVTSGSRGWAEYYMPAGDRFIRSLDVRMNYISTEDAVFVQAPNSTEADRIRVRTGDVLLTVTGSQIGRVAPVTERDSGAFISQHVAILRPKHGILPIFLSMFLSNESGGQREIARLQYGQTKPGLNLSQIREFRIVVPPLALQQQFASLVSRHERLRAVQRESLRQAEHLFQSLLHRAFTTGL